MSQDRLGHVLELKLVLESQLSLKVEESLLCMLHNTACREPTYAQPPPLEYNPRITSALCIRNTHTQLSNIQFTFKAKKRNILTTQPKPCLPCRFSPSPPPDTVVKKLSLKVVDLLNSAQEDGGKEEVKDGVTLTSPSSNSEHHIAVHGCVTWHM